jgi:hypothetical protein
MGGQRSKFLLEPLSLKPSRIILINLFLHTYIFYEHTPFSQTAFSRRSAREKFTKSK